MFWVLPGRRFWYYQPSPVFTLRSLLHCANCRLESESKSTQRSKHLRLKYLHFYYLYYIWPFDCIIDIIPKPLYCLKRYSQTSSKKIIWCNANNLKMEYCIVCGDLVNSFSIMYQLNLVFKETKVAFLKYFFFSLCGVCWPVDCSVMCFGKRN